jgi:SpoVK/Ycf46/Vps4 family AAA+-type ATPase
MEEFDFTASNRILVPILPNLSEFYNLSCFTHLHAVESIERIEATLTENEFVYIKNYDEIFDKSKKIKLLKLVKNHIVLETDFFNDFDDFEYKKVKFDLEKIIKVEFTKRFKFKLDRELLTILCEKLKIFPLNKVGIFMSELKMIQKSNVEQMTIEMNNLNFEGVVNEQNVLVEIIRNTKKVKWSQIKGYRKIKERLENIIKLNLLSDKCKKLGISPSKGLLLSGPSGCGKSLLVHGLISRFNLQYIQVRLDEIYSKYVGESEQRIREIFQRAKRLAPCVIFMDNVEALGTRRGYEDLNNGVDERVLSTLLNEMDGIEELFGVFIIACTNRIQDLDDALTRSGRLDIHVQVCRPDVNERKLIMREFEKEYNLFLNHQEFDTIIEMTDNFTPADLKVMIREAGIYALDLGDEIIFYKHIENALSAIGPSGHWIPSLGN